MCLLILSYLATISARPWESLSAICWSEFMTGNVSVCCPNRILTQNLLFKLSQRNACPPEGPLGRGRGSGQSRDFQPSSQAGLRAAAATEVPYVPLFPSKRIPPEAPPKINIIFYLIGFHDRFCPNLWWLSIVLNVEIQESMHCHCVRSRSAGCAWYSTLFL